MHTVEFAQHLIPFVTFSDAREADAWEAQELCSVMTQAVERWFSLAPANYRRTTLTNRQPAPETVTVEILNGQSTTVGAPFSQEQRGRTVFLAGDARPNEITSPNTLLYPYEGPSGTITGEVYANVVPFPDFLIERVCTHPEIVTGDGHTYQLSPLTAASRTFRLPTSPMEFGALPVQARVSYDREATPKHYWPEYIGGSHQVENDGVFQLRLYPLPTSSFIVQFDAEILPLPYRLPALTSPQTLPVPDSMCHRTLIPLAKGILAGQSAIFDDARHAIRANALFAAMERAETDIRNLTPTWVPSEIYGGTPRGW